MKQENINLFGRLLLWQKFAILSVIATVLVAIPFYLFYKSEQKTIDITLLEQEGLRPAAYAIELLKAVQIYRDLAFIDKESAESDRGKAKALVDQQIDKIDKIIGAYDYPDLPQAWTAFKEEWGKQTLSIYNKTLTPEKIWDRQTQLVGQIFSILDLILSGSTMDLDPDAKTYYLIQAVLVNTPTVTEKMAQARHFGATALTNNSYRTENSLQHERLLLSGLIGRSQELAIASKNDIERSVKNMPELKNRIYGKTHDALALIEQANKITANEIVEAKTLTYPIQEYLNIYNQSIEQQFAYITSGIDAINNQFDKSLDETYVSLYSSMAIVLSMFFISAGIAYFISISITNPVSYLVRIMNRLAAGDTQARANIKTLDEIGELGRQFDYMVDQREAVNAKIQKENEILNNSVIELLMAVAQLAQRDLTVKVPVSEDVTGPIADALNLLSFETARVLNQVVSIADQVSEVSKQVKTQSDNVINVAREEKLEIEQTVAELNQTSEVLLDIAKLAVSCNAAAENAIQNTDKAQETVLSTVQGITSIRDTIRETEKRIKRLGERSQEIGGVVSIINNIAERTHILALNASMHAASAGEAGKGFAVVANEVQKLAENAREATSQISGLVNNIQVETADTVITMNDAISQVIKGTALAQQAGNEMRENREATANLVQLVQLIAADSKAQTETTKRLQERALQIQKSTEQTFENLQSQGIQTERLVDYSNSLVKSVGVFVLPKIE